MYNLDPNTGDIQLEDGSVISPPYDDPRYLDYAAWVQIGNVPGTFENILPEVVPTKVTRFQARAALLMAGYFDSIETYMNLESTPKLQKLAWVDALEFERQSPLVQSLSALFGLTEQQIDLLFIQASKIKS